MKIKVLSIDYLIGLFETDGCFVIQFKKDATMALGYFVCPIAVFTQRSHFLLKCVMLTLDFHKIPYVFEDHAQKGRGSNVKIAGIKNVKKLMAFFCVNAAHGPVRDLPLMHGLKCLDFFLMKAIYSIIEAKEHNSPKGRLKIIDLKYSLHNPSSVINVIDAIYNRLSRSEWEKRHGFELGSSVNAAQYEKIEAHNQYQNHKQKTKLVNCATYIRNPEYISGIIEGDGCITLGILNRNQLSFPRFTASLKVVVEDGGQLLLEVIAQYFGETKPYIAKDAKKKAWYYHSSKYEILKKLYDHCKRYPILESKKQVDCLGHILSVWERSRLPIGSTDGLKLEEATQIAMKIYDTSRDLARRKKSLEKVLFEIAAWYSA